MEFLIIALEGIRAVMGNVWRSVMAECLWCPRFQEKHSKGCPALVDSGEQREKAELLWSEGAAAVDMGLDMLTDGDDSYKLGYIQQTARKKTDEKYGLQDFDDPDWGHSS